MEIILAIVVVAAVIFFGALISMGNEHQRKAIDGLREQVVLWAIHDLQIKREHLARNVDVQDPLGWLNKVASRICGHDLNLKILQTFDTPQSLICTSDDGSIKIAFSPYSPTYLRRLKRGKQNRLSQFSGSNPMLCLPRGVRANAISALNEGPLFDLEISVVWKELTGRDFGRANLIWMYEYP